MASTSVTVALTAADDDGICASQTPLAAGNLTIAGALATSGVATMDKQRKVLITAAGDESGLTFTVYGTNKDGTSISEAVTGPNATTTSTGLDFKTVTRVAISAAAAGAVKVGTSGVGASPWMAVNPHAYDPTVHFDCDVTGTINLTVQYTTESDPFCFRSSTVSHIAGTAFGDLTSKTADAVATVTFPFTAWRVLVNSGTGSAIVRAVQVGN